MAFFYSDTAQPGQAFKQRNLGEGASPVLYYFVGKGLWRNNTGIFTDKSSGSLQGNLFEFSDGTLVAVPESDKTPVA